jgi:hypothetical protein
VAPEIDSQFTVILVEEATVADTFVGVSSRVVAEAYED